MAFPLIFLFRDFVIILEPYSDIYMSLEVTTLKPEHPIQLLG